jgi:hypothetical protein
VLRVVLVLLLQHVLLHAGLQHCLGSAWLLHSTGSFRSKTMSINTPLECKMID